MHVPKTFKNHYDLQCTRLLHHSFCSSLLGAKASIAVVAAVAAVVIDWSNAWYHRLWSDSELNDPLVYCFPPFKMQCACIYCMVYVDVYNVWMCVNQLRTEAILRMEQVHRQCLTCQYCIDCHHTNCLTHIDFNLKCALVRLLDARAHALLFAYRSHWFDHVSSTRFNFGYNVNSNHDNEREKKMVQQQYNIHTEFSASSTSDRICAFRLCIYF